MKMSTRRKLSIATWSRPTEGNIYGKLTLDVREALRYLQYLRDISGEKVTITHLVGKAVGAVLKSSPDLNGRIVFGNYKQYPDVSVSFLVATDDGKDLAKIKMSDIDRKSTVEIARELRERAAKLRAGKDTEWEKNKPILRNLPTWLIKPIVWATGLLTGAMGVAMPSLGLEAFPFGACVITSVGMFDIDEGYAPPVPFAHVPFLLAVTRIRDEVVAEHGLPVIRPQMHIMATIDHRFMDGYQGAQLATVIRKYFARPWMLDGLESAPYAAEPVDENPGIMAS